MPLKIIRDDITRVNADAIVNAANSELTHGGGVCGAIFVAAGAKELSQACRAIGSCPVGQSVITPGYDLPARYIIHTVGPIWQGGRQNEQALLAGCYRTSLQLAIDHKLESVAFPLIATGIYHYPKEEALQVAISEIGAFLREHDLLVYLVVYDKESFAISRQRSMAITAYIDDHYVDAHIVHRRFSSQESLKEEADAVFMCEDKIMPSMSHMDLTKAVKRPKKDKRKLNDIIIQLDESFSQMLLRLIDEKGLKDSDVYKRANIDRRHFSKIRSNKDYQASKLTALALAIALELSLDETRDLLKRAGFALSHSSKFDIIVEYFILEHNYNIFEINETLFAFDQPLLGA